MMAQICPSPSRQLVVAAAGFRRARQKFPKNLGICACSANRQRTYFQTNQKNNGTPARVVVNSNTRARERGNCASFPSLSSSRMASRSNECHGDQRVTKSETAYVACGKRCAYSRDVARATVNGDSKIVQEQQYSRVADVTGTSKMSNYTCRDARRKTATSLRRIESRELAHGTELTKRKLISDQKSRETVSSSNSTHSFYRQKKKGGNTRFHVRSERITSSRNRSPPKINGCLTKCRLHGHPDRDREAIVVERIFRSDDEVANINCNDSPTQLDFPTKLQTWEHRTQQRFNKREMPSCRRASFQKNFSKDQISEFSKPRHCLMHETHYSHRLGKSSPITETKTEEPNPNADVCLRPSLIKAAQRNVELTTKNLQKQRTDLGRSLKKPGVNSTWNENFKIIKHRDSMSILMEKFKRLNNYQPPHCTGKNDSKDINEINSTLDIKKKFEKSDQTSPTSEDVMLHKIPLQRDTDSVTNRSIRSFEDEIESTEYFPPGKKSPCVNSDAKFQRSIVQKQTENNPSFKNFRRVCYT